MSTFPPSQTPAENYPDENRGRTTACRQFTSPRFNALTLLTILTITTSSCSVPRPLKGGKAQTVPKSTGGIEQTLVQGDNPSATTTQNQEMVKVRTYTLPVGTRIDQSAIGIAAPNQSLNAPTPQRSNLLTAFTLSAPMPVTEREETRARTELGAAQKDTAREIGAKLSSLKAIVWVGIAMFIFGLASFAWPPLKAVIGSVTTSAAITLGGLALMILPTLIVGNELFILGGVALVIAAWSLAHRHGHLRGKLDSIPINPSNRQSNNPSFPPRTSRSRNPATRAPRQAQ